MAETLPRWKRMEVERMLADQAVRFWDAREAMHADADDDAASLAYETENAGLAARVAAYREVARTRRKGR
jgi:hypothetical protein